MTRFDELVRRLGGAHVEYVLIGGVAAVAHGYDGSTFDFDICARFSPENLDRLLGALGDVELQFAPPSGRAVTESGDELAGYRYLAWKTSLGRLDVLREVEPLGSFDELVPLSLEVLLFEQPVRVLSLEALIRVKEHLGRDKDLRMLPALKALRSLRE